MIPIAPIISNVLGLGIPLIVDLVNKGKGKKKARQLSAKASNVVSNIQLGFGGAMGAADLGLHQTGTIPEEVANLPEWMQYSYFALFISGVILKFISQRMVVLADNTEEPGEVKN